MKWLLSFLYRPATADEALKQEQKSQIRSPNDDFGHHPMTETYEARTKVLLDRLLCDNFPERAYKLADDAGIVQVQHWDDEFSPDEKFVVSYLDWTDKDAWGCPMQYSFVLGEKGDLINGHRLQAHLQPNGEGANRGIPELKFTYYQALDNMEAFLVETLEFTLENSEPLPPNTDLGFRFPSERLR